jgi:hypothetical protein
VPGGISKMLLVDKLMTFPETFMQRPLATEHDHEYDRPCGTVASRSKSREADASRLSTLCAEDSMRVPPKICAESPREPTEIVYAELVRLVGSSSITAVKTTVYSVFGCRLPAGMKSWGMAGASSTYCGAIRGKEVPLQLKMSCDLGEFSHEENSAVAVTSASSSANTDMDTGLKVICPEQGTVYHVLKKKRMASFSWCPMHVNAGREWQLLQL